MKCRKCNAEIKKGDIYCIECGAKQTAKETKKETVKKPSRKYFKIVLIVLLIIVIIALLRVRQYLRNI